MHALAFATGKLAWLLSLTLDRPLVIRRSKFRLFVTRHVVFSSPVLIFIGIESQPRQIGEPASLHNFDFFQQLGVHFVQFLIAGTGRRTIDRRHDRSSVCPKREEIQIVPGVGHIFASVELE